MQIQELAGREMDVVVVLNHPLLNEGLAFLVARSQELHVQCALSTCVGISASCHGECCKAQDLAVMAMWL